MQTPAADVAADAFDFSVSPAHVEGLVALRDAADTMEPSHLLRVLWGAFLTVVVLEDALKRRDPSLMERFDAEATTLRLPAALVTPPAD